MKSIVSEYGSTLIAVIFTLMFLAMITLMLTNSGLLYEFIDLQCNGAIC